MSQPEPDQNAVKELQETAAPGAADTDQTAGGDVQVEAATPTDTPPQAEGKPAATGEPAIEGAISDPQARVAAIEAWGLDMATKEAVAHLLPEFRELLARTLRPRVSYSADNRGVVLTLDGGEAVALDEEGVTRFLGPAAGAVTPARGSPGSGSRGSRVESRSPNPESWRTSQKDFEANMEKIRTDRIKR